MRTQSEIKQELEALEDFLSIYLFRPNYDILVCSALIAQACALEWMLEQRDDIGVRFVAGW